MTKSFLYNSWTNVSNIILNQTSVTQVVFAGKVGPEQQCYGSEIDILYTVDNNEFAFTFKRKQEVILYGTECFQTDQPELFFKEIDYKVENTEAIKSIQSGGNLVKYMNAKFVYIERHISTQIEHLYANIIHQMCLLEQKIIHNSLTLPDPSPDLFALNIMKKRGYIAAIRGDMVLIMQCAPVSFTLRTEKYCYEQAPVTVNNESYFLQPRIYILKKNDTQIECNNVTPHKLHPHTKPYWVYEEIKNPAEKACIRTVMSRD